MLSRLLSRRSFMARSAAGAIASASRHGLTPMGWLLPEQAESLCTPPPALPTGVTAYLQQYRNWSGEIVVDALWTCAPSTPAHVAALANWAYAHGYRLRPKGYTHNWSPLTVAPGTSCTDKVLLVDTTASLTAIRVDGGPPASVTVQTGASMESLLQRLEESGYGLTANPAPGDLTVGGVLAIGGHGTAVAADGEMVAPGHTFGSVSNMIASVTAVVWDPAQTKYVLRTFDRADPTIAALMTHLGRSFVTEVTLRVGTNDRLRCQSFLDISAAELFGAPGSSGRSVDWFLMETGRIEVIWFPFTRYPWLKVWSESPTRPAASREVSAPYNYPFSDNLPPEVTSVYRDILAGLVWLAPTAGNLQLAVVAAGLTASLSWDIWGWSKNTTLYVKPTTLRVTANGYAIVCRRSDVQRVIYDFVQEYRRLVAAYQLDGRYPMNGPVEIRVTGLDQPSDVGISGAQVPSLSALKPRPDHPEWNAAVWLDILTLPGTPYAEPFYRDMEQWCRATYTGTYASLRVEWSKGWGYTTTAAWSDPDVIGTTVPDSLSAGQPAGQQFENARASLDELDPHRIFSSPLLDALLP